MVRKNGTDFKSKRRTICLTPGPQPQNQIAPTADAQIRRALSDGPRRRQQRERQREWVTGLLDFLRAEPEFLTRLAGMVEGASHG